MTKGHQEYWNSIVKTANTMREILNDKPEGLKIGFFLSPGSILNAYREGDLTFDEAVEKIEGLHVEKENERLLQQISSLQEEATRLKQKYEECVMCSYTVEKGVKIKYKECKKCSGERSYFIDSKEK